MARLWVVEMWLEGPKGKMEWQPTTNVAFSRASAKAEVNALELHNPEERFRARQYRRVEN